MSRIDYEMTAADLRTFDRWHARGAAILLAALLLMPWLLGLGPNAARDGGARAPSAAASAAGTESAAPALSQSDAAAATSAPPRAEAAPTDASAPASR